MKSDKHLCLQNDQVRCKSFWRPFSVYESCFIISGEKRAECDSWLEVMDCNFLNRKVIFRQKDGFEETFVPTLAGPFQMAPCSNTTRQNPSDPLFPQKQQVVESLHLTSTPNTIKRESFTWCCMKRAATESACFFPSVKAHEDINAPGWGGNRWRHSNEPFN